MRWIAAAGLLLAGCPIAGTDGQCQTDDDCGGGTVCANTTHACVAPETVHVVRLRWTISGQTASPITCSPIPQLEVGIGDIDGFEEPSDYAPVPCTVGQFTFDSLPRTFDRAHVTAMATGERQEAVIPDGDDVTVDFVLETGDPFVPDAGIPDAEPAP